MARTRKMPPVPPTMSVMDETIVSFKDWHLLPGCSSRQTLNGWIIRGLRASHGSKPCYLEWCKIGSTKHTSLEAYRRFNQALNS